MKNIKKIILKTSAGGLGDHLRLSTISELANNNGIECYLHKDNNYSNKDIYDLVWKENPYIKGIVDDYENAIDLTDAEYRRIMKEQFPDSQYSFIENIELIYDLPPTNQSPKLYYKPTNISFLNDKVLVDLNAKTHFYHYQLDLDTFIPLLLNELDMFNPNQIVLIEIPGIENFNNYIPFYEEIPKSNIVKSTTLEESADMLYSSKLNLLLHSGSSSLSCALNKPSITFIRDTEYNYYKKCWNNWLFEPTTYKVFESHIKEQE
jgi:hypothetical protein